MIEVEMERAAVNMDALYEQLKAQIGVEVGVGFRRGVVVLYCADSMSAEQMVAARKIAEDHDPSLLTQKQADALVARQELDIARRSFDPAVKDTDAALNWLVLEVRRLAAKFPD
jgi:hypothetical protein